ncbi:MAG: glycosyltransferase family 4 protein [Thermoproteales archaeon]|nr:glycosyltransferase family 4 protein [Thermoproteales archaeon]
MKVLLVNSLFGRRVSGSGHHVYTLWKYLKNRVEFEVWHVENIGYVNIPKLKSITFYLKAKKRKIPSDVDIIHVHNPKFAGLFVKTKRNVLTIHGDYKTEFKLKYGLLAKPIIKYIDTKVGNAEVITCVSPYWSKLYGWKWIPNMVELNEINKIEPAGESYLLFVGRDDPVKNYPLFRKIAREVFNKFKVKSLALGLCREDTEYLKHDKVSWESVISYMKSAYALVITSKQEGFPTVLLEAWASGCPVIAKSIPPMKTISDMFPGVLLLFDTIDEALRRIESINDEDLRKVIVNNGYKIVKNFDASRVANQYYELYRGLL